MKKLLVLALLGSVAVLCTAQTARAVVLDRTFTNEMGALAPLWDISGNYTNDLGKA